MSKSTVRRLVLQMPPGELAEFLAATIDYKVLVRATALSIFAESPMAKCDILRGISSGTDSNHFIELGVACCGKDSPVSYFGVLDSGHPGKCWSRINSAPQKHSLTQEPKT